MLVRFQKYENARSPIVRRRAGSSYLLLADDRTATNVGFVHHQAQLIDDPVPYWKPVELV